MGAFGVGALLKGILSTNEFSLTFAIHWNSNHCTNPSGSRTYKQQKRSFSFVSHSINRFGGTTPDTSIVGAIFAILLAQIPLRWLKPFKNIHRQNLVQTTISGATFASANCMFTFGI